MCKFQRYNCNPWGKSTGDCTIRAVLAGSLYGYKYLCEEFGVKNDFEYGIGLKDGVPLKNIKTFSDKTGIITSYDLELTDDMTISQFEYQKAMQFNGFKISFWMDNLKLDKTNSKIIFICKKRPYDTIDKESDTVDYHTVYGNLKTRTIYDTWDSRDCVVIDSYIVSKTAKPEDDHYYKNDFIEMKKEYEKNISILNDLFKNIKSKK